MQDVLANPMRGEVVVVVDGTAHVARLSLGALAALEAQLAEPSLIALAERFELGRFSAGDVLAVLEAGLRAGGWRGERADLLAADLAGGPIAAARAAAELLARAFSVGD